MRIADLQGPFYHGTRKRFSVGDKLVAQPDGYAQGSPGPFVSAREVRSHLKIERAIEQFRPADAVSRFDAVYMVAGDNLKEVLNLIDMAGGYLEYVYEVEPATPITKCNLVWYGQLADAALGNGHVLRKKSWVEECATKYWNAVPYNGQAFRDCYEYLSPYAIVKRLVHEE